MLERDDASHRGVNLPRAALLVLRHEVTHGRRLGDTVAEMRGEPLVAVVRTRPGDHGLIEPVGRWCHPLRGSGVELDHAPLAVEFRPRLDFGAPSPRVACQLDDLIPGECGVDGEADFLLRKGEALGLLWEDVDFDRGTLRVRKTLSRSSGGLVRTDPKTDKSRRTLLLRGTAAAVLRQHRITQLEERVRAANIWKDTGHVFTTETGQPMDPQRSPRYHDSRGEGGARRSQRSHSQALSGDLLA